MTVTARRPHRRPTQRKTAKAKPAHRSIIVVVEQDADGFFAHCPALQGCYTQGETYDEALSNIKDAVQLHIADRLANGEHLPNVEAMTLTVLQVSS